MTTQNQYILNFDFHRNNKCWEIINPFFTSASKVALWPQGTLEAVLRVTGFRQISPWNLPNPDTTASCDLAIAVRKRVKAQLLLLFPSQVQLGSEMCGGCCFHTVSESKTIQRRKTYHRTRQNASTTLSVTIVKILKSSIQIK